jgi:hypothetical protein
MGVEDVRMGELQLHSVDHERLPLGFRFRHVPRSSIGLHSPPRALAH